MNFKEMDKKNKIIMISGISVASIALTAAITSAFYTPEAPDPKELGPRTKVTYMASKQFARLPEAEKTKYIQKMGRPSRQTFSKLSSEERKAVFKNTRKVMYKQMKKRINKFFKMNKEEQDAFLDKMIARWDKRRKEMQARRAASGNSGNSGRRRERRPRGNRQAMMQGILEKTDSTTRAQMHEFFKRLRERRNKNRGK